MDASRRTVLLLGVSTLACGCSASGSQRSPTVVPTGAGATAETESASASPAGGTLPDVRPWQVSPNDREPECKGAAVRYVERTETSSSRVLEVIDAQYGGLLADSASVLVITRSWRRVGGRVVPGGRTYDVRLSRRGPRWHVDEVHPSQPGAPAARPSPLARQVLGSGRIDLPPAARRDVQAGAVHASVLTAMLAVSRTHQIGISVLRSGHPLSVFGTSRPSDHPQGRAFDTWRIDDHPVVGARTSRGLVTDYMHAVATAGAYNVGGPYLLGSAPQWFSDDTHHDHVHAGFLT